VFDSHVTAATHTHTSTEFIQRFKVIVSLLIVMQYGSTDLIIGVWAELPFLGFCSSHL